MSWITPQISNRYMVMLKNADKQLYPSGTLTTYGLLKKLKKKHYVPYLKAVKQAMSDGNITPAKIEGIKRRTKIGAYMNNLVRRWIVRHYPDL